MEYAMEKALQCSGCGTPRDLGMAKGADEDFDVEPIRCHACHAKYSKAKGWKADHIEAWYFPPVHTGNGRR